MFTQTLKSFNIIHILRNMGLGQDLKFIPIFNSTETEWWHGKKKNEVILLQKSWTCCFY